MNLEPTQPKPPRTFNPFRSRSTLICMLTLASFLIFSYMIVLSGYFDAGFAAAGLMFLGNIVKFALDHQQKATDSKTESK